MPQAVPFCLMLSHSPTRHQATSCHNHRCCRKQGTALIPPFEPPRLSPSTPPYLRTLATPRLSVPPDSRPSPTQTALRPLSALRPLLPSTGNLFSCSLRQITLPREPRRKPYYNSATESKTTCRPKTQRRSAPVCRTITAPPIWPRKQQRKRKGEWEEGRGNGNGDGKNKVRNGKPDGQS